jgi:hypothetical protein
MDFNRSGLDIGDALLRFEPRDVLSLNNIRVGYCFLDSGDLMLARAAASDFDRGSSKKEKQP